MSVDRKPLRGKRSARRVDITPMREALKDRRQWVVMGLVFDPGDGNGHFTVVTDDEGFKSVMVEVESVPDRVEMSCTLESDNGLWRIPNPGDQVVVVIPSGEVEFVPTIVAVRHSAPSRASAGRTILVASDSIEVTAPKVILGPDPGAIEVSLDGLVHGRGIDTFTGQTYAALGNASAKVLGNK